MTINITDINNKLCTIFVHNSVFSHAINSLLHIALLVSVVASSLTYAAGYSVEELKALSERERQVQPMPEINQEALLQKARQFEQQSKNQLTEALATLKLEGGNPQENAAGVIVFVSLSMPKTSLTQLLMQSEQLQIPLIVRGVQPHGFTATVKQMNALIDNKNKPINSGFGINPKWFTQFGITQVPAFVAIKPGKCQMNDPCSPNDFDVVYGNVSMYDALSILAQYGEVPDVAANALAKRG